MKHRLFNPFRLFVGAFFGISILFTSLFGNYIITMFLFLIFLGKHRLWRRLMDRAISFWMMIPLVSKFTTVLFDLIRYRFFFINFDEIHLYDLW